MLTWPHWWLTLAPAVSRMSAMTRCPCQQAESSADLIPLSTLFTSAPLSNKTWNVINELDIKSKVKMAVQKCTLPILEMVS